MTDHLTNRNSCTLQFYHFHFNIFCSELPGRALLEKGMKIRLVTTEKDFIEEIKKPEVNEAWVISSMSMVDSSVGPVRFLLKESITYVYKNEFVQACIDYNNKGGGLCVWG